MRIAPTMPFREKAKSLFKTRSRTDRDSLSKASSIESQAPRWPSNVYRPGEPMPRPKYRAIPKKEHKEKLEAFSFADAWRRKSFQSQYSPMGTRAPSRRNSSRGASRRNSIFSLGKKSASRTNSVTSVDTDAGAKKHRDAAGHGAARPTPLSTEPELEGDDDVGNGESAGNLPSSPPLPRTR